MERDVVRVITPGTVTEPGLLDARRNNYIAAPSSKAGRAGIAYADITTGEFATTEISSPPADLHAAVQQELDRLHPAELLVPGEDESHNGRARQIPGMDDGQRTTDDRRWTTDSWQYRHPQWQSAIRIQSSVLTHSHRPARLGARSGPAAAAEALFGGFAGGLRVRPPAAGYPGGGRAAGLYRRDQQCALTQLTRLVTYSTEQYMTLDPHTRRNLEIAEGHGGRRNSLLWVLDDTRTAMGSRLLSRWLNQPLLDLGQAQRPPGRRGGVRGQRRAAGRAARPAE